MSELPNIGKTATAALETINVFTLDDLSQYDEENILKLHGVGPKVVNILKKTMSEAELSFAKSEELPVKTKFALFGDLNCNNAPKREIVRDYLIALAQGNQSLLKQTTSESLEFFSPTDGESSILTVLNISSIQINKILSHGKEAASEMRLVTTKGEICYLSHFYNFESHKKDAKIKTVTEYVVKAQK